MLPNQQFKVPYVLMKPCQQLMISFRQTFELQKTCSNSMGTHHTRNVPVPDHEMLSLEDSTNKFTDVTHTAIVKDTVLRKHLSGDEMESIGQDQGLKRSSRGWTTMLGEL